MSEVTEDAGECRVGRPRWPSTSQVGEVRAHLAHFCDEPRMATLERLELWPIWDAMLEECEERIKNEYALGVSTTLDTMLDAQRRTAKRLRKAELTLDGIKRLEFRDEDKSLRPQLSVYRFAWLYVMRMVDPGAFAEECKKRELEDSQLQEECTLWETLLAADSELAAEWDEAVAMLVGYLARERPGP